MAAFTFSAIFWPVLQQSPVERLIYTCTMFSIHIPWPIVTVAMVIGYAELLYTERVTIYVHMEQMSIIYIDPQNGITCNFLKMYFCSATQQIEKGVEILTPLLPSVSAH